MLEHGNKERGKKLFDSKIAAMIPKVDEAQKSRLELLGAAFGGLAVVMPEEGCYAAARLSKAVIQAAGEPSVVDEALVGRVVELYNEFGGAQAVQDSITTEEDSRVSKMQKFAFQMQMDEEAPQVHEQMINHYDDDGNLLKSYGVMVDSINLIDYVDKSELSSEGMRARGILPANFDSLKDIAPDLEDDTDEEAEVVLDAQGNVESIACPKCKSKDLYQIAFERYGCFGCDYEFNVQMSLGDVMNTPENQARTISDKWRNIGEGFKRVEDRVKRNRGIIRPGERFD